MPQGAILSPSDVARVAKIDDRILGAAPKRWIPNRQQFKVFQRTEYQILYAGSRYGGKTEAGIRWLIQGNPDRPNFDAVGQPVLVNSSYVYHPNFLGAVIRKNEKDLAEWVDRAKPLYEAFGGEYTKAPAEFRFPSGARIFLGHAAEQDAWEKYQGLNITRYLIEEAGQIPSFRLYELLRASCRCPYLEMRAQLLLNANPGGAFHNHLCDYFIEPKDPSTGELLVNPKTGKPYQPEETIEEEVSHPFTGEKMILTRVWIPSYLTDNPHAVKDTTYVLSLASIRDDKVRKAFLYGDWKAFEGSFLTLNRERHVLAPEKLPIQPWMTAYASLDIGYEHDSACHFARQNPETEQICIFDEWGGSHIDAFEVGAQIARMALPILRTQPRLIVFVSHDAYHERTGEITYVDILRKGAAKIIGKDSVYAPDRILDMMRDRAREEGREWDEAVEREILDIRGKGIIFRKAPRGAAAIYAYIRGLMRLEPLIINTAVPDWETARRICFENGPDAYYRYLEMFRRDEEVLPKLLISETCKKLIAAIPKLMHDEEKVDEPSRKHFEGRDYLDSMVYLLAGMRDMPLSKEPYQVRREKVIAAARLRKPDITTQELVWINMRLEEEEEERKEKPFSLPRRMRALPRRRPHFVL